MIISIYHRSLQGLFIFLLLLISPNIKGQLKNTIWLGELRMPFPMECFYSFQKDTARLSMIETNEDFEVMLYHTKSDTLFLSKLYGISPCPIETIGAYLFRIKDEKLYLKPLDDNCMERAASFPVLLTRLNKEPIN